MCARRNAQMHTHRPVGSSFSGHRQALAQFSERLACSNAEPMPTIMGTAWFTCAYFRDFTHAVCISLLSRCESTDRELASMVYSSGPGCAPRAPHV